MKHRSLKKNLVIFALISLFYALCSMFYVPSVHAQQISLSISPPLLETLIKPGKSIVVAYNLVNLGDPTIIKTQVLPFLPKGDTGEIVIKDQMDGPIEYKLDNADLVLDQSFFLKNRERKQILLRVNVPEDTPDGDYYYTLIAQTQPPPAVEGQSGSFAKTTIGSNILLTVAGSGNVEIKGKIRLFALLPRFKMPFFGEKINLFDSSDKIPVVLTIENQGRNLLKPRGEIILKGNFGEKARYEIIPQNILSLSQRVVLATPSGALSCDINSKSPICESSHSLLLDGFFIGNYKLSTNLNFGESTPNLFAATSFVAIPIKAGIVLILATILGLGVMRKVKDKV